MNIRYYIIRNPAIIRNIYGCPAVIQCLKYYVSRIGKQYPVWIQGGPIALKIDSAPYGSERYVVWLYDITDTGTVGDHHGPGYLNSFVAFYGGSLNLVNFDIDSCLIWNTIQSVGCDI